MSESRRSSDGDASSTDSDGFSDPSEPDCPQSRPKRAIAWCGVEDDDPKRPQTTPQLTWPPPATSSSWRQLKPTRPPFGNPNFGTKMQLYSRTNHHLAVFADGRVGGTPDEDDMHTYLELSSAGHAGHVRIRAILTNLYIAMNAKGRLYSTEELMDDGNVFIEALQGLYSTFLSLKYAHLGWYLGVKKSGKFKKGPQTKHGQKAIRFLPRRSKFQ